MSTFELVLSLFLCERYYTTFTNIFGFVDVRLSLQDNDHLDKDGSHVQGILHDLSLEFALLSVANVDRVSVLEIKRSHYLLVKRLYKIKADTQTFGTLGNFEFVTKHLELVKELFVVENEVIFNAFGVLVLGVLVFLYDIQQFVPKFAYAHGLGVGTFFALFPLLEHFFQLLGVRLGRGFLRHC